MQGKGAKIGASTCRRMRSRASNSVWRNIQARGRWAMCWNRKRHDRPLSVKAIQKKMERYAKAAGIPASCHSLRHTLPRTSWSTGPRSSRSATS